MNHLINITKSDGTKQLFEEEKLVNSLKKVGATADMIEDVIDEVEREMKDGMSTGEIYKRAFELLRKHSSKVAVKYSLRRALQDLGPDGFPFEKFIARIFEMWGYETLTDQNIFGDCVEHEIDVVAWKGNDLAMVEAKFHNEIGLKSDLKVVLYVKARYDDLEDKTFKFGDKERKLTEKWLITNTKFTDRAVTYGACSKLKLVGWNYPSFGNLHEIIENNAMHPITCISDLKTQEKLDLIFKNILVCVDLVNKPEVLREIGMSEDRASRIIAEANDILVQARDANASLMKV